MVTRAVATQRTISTAHGLSLLSMGVPALSQALLAMNPQSLYVPSCAANGDATKKQKLGQLAG